jgi:hypothetical protein
MWKMTPSSHLLVHMVEPKVRDGNEERVANEFDTWARQRTGDSDWCTVRDMV